MSRWPRVALFCLTFLILLALNADLFTTRITEASDYAAGSIQVYNAKTFHQLLGPYSRWQFHHPGPALAYILGFGEFLFYDLLHLTPGDLNAQIITILLLNLFFVFSAISMIGKYCPHPFFWTLAMTGIVLIVYCINDLCMAAQMHNAALFSLWSPDVAIFCYFLFLTSVTVVSLGDLQKLPYAMFSGLLLVHDHVSMVLFVGVLLPVACALSIRPSFHDHNTARRRLLFVLHKKPILVSVFILCVFALPVVLEAFIDNPNNLSAILSYMHGHPGAKHSLAESVYYELSLVAFVPYVDAPRLPAPSNWMFSARLFWFLTAGMTLLVATGGPAATEQKRFVRHLSLYTAITAVLFLYWARNIEGPLYSYLGRFLYGLNLVCFIAAGMLFLGRLRFKVSSPSWSPFAWASVACAGFLLIGVCAKNTWAGDKTVLQMSIAAQKTVHGKVRLVFPHPAWPTATGVANLLIRRHVPFCVDLKWEVLFGKENTCAFETALPVLRLENASAPCVTPCSVVFNAQPIALRYEPIPKRQIPFTLAAASSTEVEEGFYDLEGEFKWTTRLGSIGFVLSDPVDSQREVAIRIRGVVLPQRASVFLLNGHVIGTILGSGAVEQTFRVPGAWFRASNRIDIVVAKAGPAGQDSRILGFRFAGIEFSYADQRTPE